MNILGLIPARGGSKSIPRKNVTLVGGRPLLSYTCKAAVDSQLLTRVLLSTDDEEIAHVGRNCGVEAPFLRPLELAKDDTPSLPVAQHAVQWLIEQEGWKPDIVVLLQPTSPLRQARHIDEALSQMIKFDADTVVSVIRVPHCFNPYSLMQLQNGILQDFWNESPSFDRFRRQNLPSLYARNGPAILATRVEVMFENESFYGKRIIPYIMSEEESIDIDTQFDLRLADWLLTQEKLID